MYIRFESELKFEQNNCPKGIFAAMGDCRRSGKMNLRAHMWYSELARWFDDNLEYPDCFFQPIFSQVKFRALSWFALRFNRFLEKALLVVNFLRLNDFVVNTYISHNPGKVIFKSENQVVVLPETAARLTVREVCRRKVPQYLLNLPGAFFDVVYESTRIPGCPEQSNLQLGANCQVYAYEVLRFFNRFVPSDRSSELWVDKSYSMVVEDFEPLDLMLYNRTDEPYGAHVGLYAGEGMVLHLSQDNGVPKYERHQELLKSEKYRCFIGAKRVCQ